MHYVPRNSRLFQREQNMGLLVGAVDELGYYVG